MIPRAICHFWALGDECVTRVGEGGVFFSCILLGVAALFMFGGIVAWAMNR